jgi:hypothetical protein
VVEALAHQDCGRDEISKNRSIEISKNRSIEDVQKSSALPLRPVMSRRENGRLAGGAIEGTLPI